MSDEAEGYRRIVEDGLFAVRRLEVEFDLLKVRLDQAARGNGNALKPVVEILPQCEDWIDAARHALDAVWWRGDWK